MNWMSTKHKKSEPEISHGILGYIEAKMDNKTEPISKMDPYFLAKVPILGTPKYPS